MLRLREWRERRGHSLRQLGELSGVHFVSLARMEAGQIDPQLSTLLKLCAALHITLNDLVKQPGKKGGKSYGTHQTKR
jgi:transcriptional regulator with XRE-family HTH domain